MSSRLVMFAILFSAFAVTFISEADINGCTVDLNSLATAVGGTFNGYYTEWDCTSDVGVSNVIVTCRWFWNNHFEMIFEPAAAGYDNWVLLAGYTRYSRIGWIYFLEQEIDKLSSSGIIPLSCTPVQEYIAGDYSGMNLEVIKASVNGTTTVVTWYSPKPSLLWACYIFSAGVGNWGVYINDIPVVACGSGGNFFTAYLYDSSPFFVCKSVGFYGTIHQLVVSPEDENYSLSSGTYLSTKITSPGTLRAIKKIEPLTVEVGSPVVVTVRFDVPESTNISVTDYIPLDWAPSSTLDVNVTVLDALTDSIVSSSVQTVTLSTAGSYKTFSVSIPALSENEYVVLTYTLTAPLVASPTTYTFPSAEITFEVPA